MFELPPMAVRVTEHQLVARRCGCGATTGAAAPEGVTAPVQYGPRITAVVLYLYVGQFLAKKRAAQAMAELFGTPVSEGTVSAMTERAADGLGGFLGAVKQQIAEADVAGFDETGLRVAGKLHWVHCARTGKYTLITCHPKRGRTGIDDAGVLARFTGVAVHDAWAPYDTYPDPGHQLCCAHALRELQGIADLAAPESDWCWAGQVADALVAIQNLVADAVAAGASTLDEDALATQLHLYRCAAHIGITETAARGDTITKRHNALARRLIDRQDDYLRFTTNWRIPPDNNGSERDIRMIKLRQKISGCLRTLTGAKQFCAIRTTCPPRPNTVAHSSTPSSCSPRDDPGCPHNLTSYAQIIRRDHVVAVGQRRNQAPKHIGAGRKSVQEDQHGRIRVTCFAIEQSMTIDGGVTMMNSRHERFLLSRCAIHLRCQAVGRGNGVSTMRSRPGHFWVMYPRMLLERVSH